MFKSSVLLLPLALLVGCGGSSYDSDYYVTQAVATANLDGNGPSILSANAVFRDSSVRQGFVSVRLPSTPGTFLDPLRSATGYYPVALATGDLNGDSRPDLVVATYSSSTSTYGVQVQFQSSTTPGTFGTPVPLSTGTRRPVDLVLADLKGEDRLDIVVAATGGSSLLVFFHDTVVGTFQTATPVEVGGTPNAVAVGDLTGSDRLDLVAALDDGHAAVVLHDTAAGSFLAPVSYGTGGEPIAVRLVDVNGDDQLDLLTANFNNGTGGVSLLLGAGDGTFGSASTLDTLDYYSASLAVADLNGDTRPDIAVANMGLPGYPGSVSVFLQSATVAGTFGTAQLYSGYYGPQSIAVADFQGSGYPALVIADGTPCVRFPDPDLHGAFLAPVWLKQ